MLNRATFKAIGRAINRGFIGIALVYLAGLIYGVVERRNAADNKLTASVLRQESERAILAQTEDVEARSNRRKALEAAAEERDRIKAVERLRQMTILANKFGKKQWLGFEITASVVEESNGGAMVFLGRATGNDPAFLAFVDRIAAPEQTPAAGEDPEPSSYAVFADSDLGDIKRCAVGRYWWSVLPKDELAVYFGEAYQPAFDFVHIDSEILDRGELSARLMDRSDGSRWRLIVKDYKVESLSSILDK